MDIAEHLAQLKLDYEDKVMDLNTTMYNEAMATLSWHFREQVKPIIRMMWETEVTHGSRDEAWITDMMREDIDYLLTEIKSEE